MCVRTLFCATKWNGLAGNPAPEGRPSLAQRFSAGKSGKKDSSPGEPALSEVEGTEFSRTHFRGWVLNLFSAIYKAGQFFHRMPFS